MLEAGLASGRNGAVAEVGRTLCLGTAASSLPEGNPSPPSCLPFAPSELPPVLAAGSNPLAYPGWPEAAQKHPPALIPSRLHRVGEQPLRHISAAGK